MQANNDPKWTADAAFWNEAWANMDERLNQESPQNRKTPVVWWRRYGWLLGLFLLVTAVATPAAMAYLSQDEKVEQEPISPQAPIIPATPPPAIIAKIDHELSNQESRYADRTSNEPAIDNNGSGDHDVPRPSSEPITTNTPSSTSKQAPPSVLSTEKEDTDINEAAAATATLVATAPEKETGVAILNRPTAEFEKRETLAALATLTKQPIGPIEFAKNLGTDQLAVMITKPKLASRLYLNAGLSNGLQGTTTGYYAGLQYNIPVSKRFSIPVGIRYRKDFHNFKELSASGTPARFLEASTPTAAVTPDTILVTFSDENIDEIVTSAFEGSIGLTYSPAPRWQIGTSVSLNYLIAAKARISSQYSAEFAVDQSNRNILDADFALVNSLSFSRFDNSFSPLATPIPAGAGQSGFPRFNQWIAYAGLNVAYDFTKKLTLTLAGRHLLAQPDQSNVIGLQRGQLEIGARLRLK